MLTRSGTIRKMILGVLPVLLWLLLSGTAAAEERHTVLFPCGGMGGYVGWERNKEKDLFLDLNGSVTSSDGTEWTMGTLLKQPDFRLLGAALRFEVKSVQGEDLLYSLVCGKSRSTLQTVLPGRNMWDVTAPVSAWAEAPGNTLAVVPFFRLNSQGIRIAADSVFLQITFSTTAKLPLFPLDRVKESPIYDASLCMLESGNTFLNHYDDMADSLLSAQLPLGVPYYYAGGSEDKFLNRYFPSVNTRYYRPEHMYLCGLDCVGMTHLVYERCGLERHPSISDLLFRGIGSAALKENDPEQWPAFLLPGDLIAVKHGTFHILMYLGTMRMFGWTEHNAGEAADLLDSPLVIHCGGNPFYHDRYKGYISEKGYRNTYPPDGGVTVSVIRRTDKDAPHSVDTDWGKHFGWYVTDGQPLLVFTLEDCTDMAWYAPERQSSGT